MKIRCNWCMAEFEESEIIIKNDTETCPVCGKSGCLMDLDNDFEEKGGEN